MVEASMGVDETMVAKLQVSAPFGNGDETWMMKHDSLCEEALPVTA